MSQTAANPTSSSVKTYTGGCHCGLVRYEADIDLSAGATKCNCSICTKTGSVGVVLKPAAFRLLSGEESLSDYQFNTKTAHHLFCKRCGVFSFGRGDIPQLGGEFRSVNINCLDDVDLSGVPVKRLNGRDNTWSEM